MSRLKGVALLLILIAGICLLTPAQGSAQKPGRRVRTIRFEPNVHAPDLYADALKMQFTLVNLPGSEVKGSYWEGQYKLYFLPEGELHKNRSSNPEPKDFPNKILLAEGAFRGDQLKTLSGRTFIRGPVAFKSKIPDHMRTKFANLLTSFSIKIYDAKLKLPLYKSSVFIAHPFDDDERYSASERFAPRRIVYTSFFVTPEGDLFNSQWRREPNDTSW
jgi:hypothetical protein